jgi:dephospho-CoA kinase
VGIVGGIGSGKSAVAAVFEELGGFVIDADKVGHALLDQEPARSQILARFGFEILKRGDSSAEPDKVDRQVLGRVVFSDARARRDLEAILHPRMRQTFEKAIARTVRKGIATSVVLDAAVLHEAGWDALCDRVVFVDATREERLGRLERDRGWSEETLARREAAQRPLEETRAAAEWVVSNTGDLDALKTAVAEIWTKILRSAPRRQSLPKGPAPSDSPRPAENPRPPGRGFRPKGRPR